MIDIKYHNATSMSVKDCEEEVDISNHKWDLLFDYLVNNTSEVYFYGARLEWPYTHELMKDFTKDVEYISEHILIDTNNHNDLLVKVRIASVLLNRSLLKQLWAYYESPMLIFTKNNQVQIILNMLKGKSGSIDKAMLSVDNTYVLYKGIEMDVLWIAKSPVLIYPSV